MGHTGRSETLTTGHPYTGRQARAVQTLICQSSGISIALSASFASPSGAGAELDRMLRREDGLGMWSLSCNCPQLSGNFCGTEPGQNLGNTFWIL